MHYYIIDYAFGAALPIAHGDLDGGNEYGRDGVHSAAKLKLLHRENNTSRQNLSAEGAQATIDASDAGSMKAN